jgi:uncharacterized membrane protein YebE (DUF533 family)
MGMPDLSVAERSIVYELLVYVAWSDGSVAPEERWAVRGAAVALGLDGAGLVIADALRRGPLPVDDLGLSALTSEARTVAYASAAWMTLVDRNIAIEERAVLHVLRQRLGLSSAQASRLEAIALLTRGQAGRQWHEEYAALLGSVRALARAA